MHVFHSVFCIVTWHCVLILQYSMNAVFIKFVDFRPPGKWSLCQCVVVFVIKWECIFSFKIFLYKYWSTWESNFSYGLDPLSGISRGPCLLCTHLCILLCFLVFDYNFGLRYWLCFVIFAFSYEEHSNENIGWVYKNCIFHDSQTRGCLGRVWSYWWYSKIA